jgi:ATP-dependent DNA helicase RecG
VPDKRLAEIGIGELDGVGEKSERLFVELGITTAQELLDDLPFRYDDLREATPVERLGDDGEVNVVGRVESVRERRGRGGMEIVEVRARDDTGSFVAKWFGKRRFVYGRFHEGMRLFVRGRLERTLAEPVVNVAHYRVLTEGERYRGAMVPIYRASKELPSRKIAAVIKKNLPELLTHVGADVLPPALAREHRFPSLERAYRAVHEPADPQEAARARERFAFAEFLVIAAGAQLRRAMRERTHDAAVLSSSPALLAEFESTLPFALTNAQRRSIGEIWADMARDVPMNRLLQGDVGSGKTLVAAAAVLLAARSGYQAAIMAPTEILAAQHRDKLVPLLVPLQIPLEYVSGSQRASERRGAVSRLASGEAALAIGTHALLTEDVEFARLGLAVIDEQHRFGVEHRARLRAKGVSPHTLHMTATPIPRTLAQSLYADLDESKLDEMPPGRTPVQTFAVREARAARVYEFVRAAVERGGQAYVVAPAIEEGESGATSAVTIYERLARETFADLRVGLVHGRLAPKDKDEVMARFARGAIDVLVATTVIEVGVDVPNASVMVVLDAQRYGLAQLHQLRGRVGRGSADSFCLFVYPDDRHESDRLSILTQSNDGFAIAEADLEMRGAGEFAGTAQSGKAELRFGDIARDFSLYARAREAAERIVRADPSLRAAEHAALRDALGSSPSLHALVPTS